MVVKTLAHREENTDKGIDFCGKDLDSRIHGFGLGYQRINICTQLSEGHRCCCDGYWVHGDIVELLTKSAVERTRRGGGKDTWLANGIYYI